MSNQLFNDFDSVSSKQWKQKIQFDLNGEDYNSALIWNSNENIAVKPFYHADDFKTLPPVSNTKATAWTICQSIYVQNIEKSNLKAINAIENGAESIKFTIPSEAVSIDDLLKNIDISTIAIFFDLQFLSEAFIIKHSKYLTNTTLRFQTDCIGNLAKTGNWFYNLERDFKTFEAVVKHTALINIDATTYQNAGANIVQQLAYILAHTNEYLNYLDKKKSLKRTLKIHFNVAIGSNYFFEIAKLKALRLLWKTLASEYNITSDCYITATPTKRNKTIYQYNTNMLRTTTECMSAILGGANTICNLPYDAIYHKDNDFGTRIARNQLLILKNESYFDKVDNPSDGSYYIETLVQQLSEKALILFKDIEKQGGFLNQLKKNTIQRKIKESAAKEQTQLNNGELVLLGINKYIDPSEAMKKELEIYPFVKQNRRKTLIEPIIEKRLSEILEQKQLKNEN